MTETNDLESKRRLRDDLLIAAEVDRMRAIAQEWARLGWEERNAQEKAENESLDAQIATFPADLVGSLAVSRTALEGKATVPRRAQQADPFATDALREKAMTEYKVAWGLQTLKAVAKKCMVHYTDLNKWKRVRLLGKRSSSKTNRIEDELIRRPPATT